MSAPEPGDATADGGVWPLLEEWADRAPLNSAVDLGAGKGEDSRWLAQRGFHVQAVEKDPHMAKKLRGVARFGRIRVQTTEIANFRPEPGSLGLAVAAASLHFLRPSELWPLADALVLGLIPGGLLICEVLTTDDPSFSIHKSEAELIEPNTFWSLDHEGVVHYFEPGELRRVFSELEPVHYREDRRFSKSATAGYRSGATLVARRGPSADL